MTRIKARWWIPGGIFLLLGIASLLPGTSESLLGYSTLGRWVPVSTAALLVFSFSFYALGRWFTQRPMKPKF